MFKVCWRWEITPKEYASGYTYISATKTVDLPLATEPFPCPRLPLPGTEFTYQLAISDQSPSHDIQAVVGYHPELPRSGDQRSGVLVFDGDKIIASGIFLNTASLVVHPDYRGHGLAARLFLEWHAATKRPTVSIHNITLATTKTLLRAHREVVERALAEGKPVPERVIRAIQDGAETAAILRQAELAA